MTQKIIDKLHERASILENELRKLVNAVHSLRADHLSHDQNVSSIVAVQAKATQAVAQADALGPVEKQPAAPAEQQPAPFVGPIQEPESQA